MPIYEFEHDSEPCELGTRFERLQPVGAPPLTQCPRCGRPCRRVASSFAAGTSCRTAARELERRGFTRYQRAGGGAYEKTTESAPGPKAIGGE